MLIEQQYLKNIIQTNLVAANYQYKAFGLIIDSEIELPELPKALGETDVTVSLGIAPTKLINPTFVGVRFESSHNEFLLRIEHIASFYVTAGNHITIDTQPNVEFDEVRLFLLGSAFGALLHQRGLLPFHGSSININNSAVIFSGHSGAGKSTLAAAFNKNGYPLLSDDVSVITMSEQGIPYVQPGYPQMKLWSDSIVKLGKEPSSYKTIRKRVEKHSVPIVDYYQKEPIQLRNIFIIVSSNLGELKIEPIKGIEKFNLLRSHTYRFNFVVGQQMQANHFNYITTLSKQVNVFRLTRPSGKFVFDEMINLILENTK